MSRGGQKISERVRYSVSWKHNNKPESLRRADKCVPFIVDHKDSPASKAFMEIVKKIEAFLKTKQKPNLN